MRSVCEVIEDKKKNGYIFSCNGLIVFPAEKIEDNKHPYIVEYEVRVSKSGRQYGVARSQEIYHPFIAVHHENKSKLSVQKFSDHYTVTLSNIVIKIEECKICKMRREKEIPENISSDIVVSGTGSDIVYTPYSDDNVVDAYTIIKYLNENSIKLEPNIIYHEIENVLVPTDINSLHVEDIKKLPEDVNAYSYDTKKFIKVNEEKKEYQKDDDEYVDIVKYYIDGGKHIVATETYKIIYEYVPTFYSSWEDDDPESYARTEKLVDSKKFENVVNVNATFTNMHREKAAKFKALYRALTNAGYRVRIMRSNGNKKIVVEKDGKYGEISKYSEFAIGYYAELAKQLYNLTF